MCSDVGPYRAEFGRSRSWKPNQGPIIINCDHDHLVLSSSSLLSCQMVLWHVMSLLRSSRTMEVQLLSGTRWRAMLWSRVLSRSSWTLLKVVAPCCGRRCLERPSLLQSVGMVALRWSWVWTNCLALRIAKRFGRLIKWSCCCYGCCGGCSNRRFLSLVSSSFFFLFQLDGRSWHCKMPRHPKAILC